MHLFRRLQDWQRLHQYTDARLAEKVGCDRSVLSRAKRGLHVLKMKHQLAIEQLTEIKPAEWAEFYAKIEAERSEAPKGKPQKKSLPASPAAKEVA